MKKIVNYVAAVVLALATTIGQANFYTGNELAEFCGTNQADRHDFANQALCSGYVIGVVDTITQLVFYDDKLCMPDGVTVEQLIKVVEKYMVDNPAKMHWPGAYFVEFAMLGAFPCK
ncbi:Rap1a/Tai family immunity protein [Granulosicoccus sp.]|nr:Rap1a/Tai family immunity protein [Granulosicoccus sp.]MDB4223911.1 Rap1a/Tai family immunity protein [Granulosicoccus sp.]